MIFDWYQNTVISNKPGQFGCNTTKKKQARYLSFIKTSRRKKKIKRITKKSENGKPYQWISEKDA